MYPAFRLLPRTHLPSPVIPPRKEVPSNGCEPRLPTLPQCSYALIDKDGMQPRPRARAQLAGASPPCKSRAQKTRFGGLLVDLPLV